MIGNALKRDNIDQAMFRLAGPYVGHPKAMRLQLRVKSSTREPSKVRCQTQTLKLALSVVLGIGHTHLLGEAKDRTPCLVLSVVHTTEHRVRDGEDGRICGSKRLDELFCSDSPEHSSDSPLKALAEIELIAGR
jgi:hypothetical protein